MRFALAALVAFVALFVVWYPPAYRIIDESTYLSTALTYRAGTIYQDVAGVQSISRVTAGGHEVGKFAPLWPAVMAPFLAAGWRGAFAANLAVHLAGFLLFLSLVRRARLPDVCALLYLAHPSLVLYSRTLMSDPLAAVLALAAWRAWRGGRTPGHAARAGWWIGLSCLVRYTNVVLAALFLVAAAMEAAREPGWRRRVAAFLGGAAPTALLLALYNQAAFGKWWRGSDGYRDDRAGIGMEGQFGWHNVPSGLEHYATALLLVWPLLLVGALLARGRDRRFLAVVGGGFTLFFCFYYYRDQGPGLLETAVVGQRFLLPVLPMFLLPYADALNRRIRGTGRRRAAGITLAAVCLAAAAAVHVRHQGELRETAARRDALYAATPPGSVVICDTEARELLHDVFGDRTAVRAEDRDRWEAPPPGTWAGRRVFVALGAGEASLPRLREAWGDAAGAVRLDRVDAGAGLAVWEVR